ncbi:hypothetical protein BZG36_00347 [Bifiguratus adelaidae]|uniref:Transmembrane protein 186 n=1 Tax=Bifiguratus adelaidae TaxID=1938954 RepID=A0A261Y807_9FUNG|nr:hypothetical protein BZG36_00347 [Bifiguratus adelaidae]
MTTIRPVTITRTTPESDEDKDAIQVPFYTGPNATAVRIVKAFSVSTLGLALTSTPVVMAYWNTHLLTSAGVSGTMFAGALAASVCSTSFLHYFLSPYVTEMSIDSKHVTPDSRITVKTLNLSARTVSTTLSLRDLYPAKDMFLSWRAKRTASKPKQSRFWIDERVAGENPTLRQCLRAVQELNAFHRLV